MANCWILELRKTMNKSASAPPRICRAKKNKKPVPHRGHHNKCPEKPANKTKVNPAPHEQSMEHYERRNNKPLTKDEKFNQLPLRKTRQPVPQGGPARDVTRCARLQPNLSTIAVLQPRAPTQLQIVPIPGWQHIYVPSPVPVPMVYPTFSQIPVPAMVYPTFSQAIHTVPTMYPTFSQDAVNCFKLKEEKA